MNDNTKTVREMRDLKLLLKCYIKGKHDWEFLWNRWPYGWRCKVCGETRDAKPGTYISPFGANNLNN